MEDVTYDDAKKHLEKYRILGNEGYYIIEEKGRTW